jgi:hypothetical protein
MDDIFLQTYHELLETCYELFIKSGDTWAKEKIAELYVMITERLETLRRNYAGKKLL